MTNRDRQSAAVAEARAAAVRGPGGPRRAAQLGRTEGTGVLSGPIDGTETVAAGVPRLLGDVVLCPQVVGEQWRAPLVHGLLHLLGYDHGDEMEAREEELR